MGLLDCVSDTSARYPVNPPSQAPMQRGMSGRRSLGIFASNASLKGKDINYWRHRLLGFLFRSEGKEDVGVLKIPLKQMGYSTIGDFIREIPPEIYEPYKSQIHPDTGLRKDYKVVWEKDGIAEPGMLKWEGTIEGQRCMGLQLDRRKAVPFGVHDGRGLFYCKVGHRALVPVNEVFPYKEFLRQFIGMPARKDSMPLNLLPGRSSVRVAVTKKYQPGDRVHIPSEGKWATILWTGRIDGEWVVDLVYEPEKVKGRVASPDEPSMSRSLSMSEFIDKVTPRPDEDSRYPSSATPPPHVPPPPPKSPPPKDDEHDSDSEDEVFVQTTVSSAEIHSASTKLDKHSESDASEVSQSEDDTDVDDHDDDSQHDDSHSDSDGHDHDHEGPSRRHVSEPGPERQPEIEHSPEPVRLEFAKKKATHKPMFNLASLGRNKKPKDKQRQTQAQQPTKDVHPSREHPRPKFQGLFSKSPKKTAPVESTKTPSSSFQRQDRSRSPVHRKNERHPSGDHRELPVDVPRELRSPTSPITPTLPPTKSLEKVEMRRDSHASSVMSGEVDKDIPEATILEDPAHKRKLSEGSSDTTPPYTPVVKQSEKSIGRRTPERRPSKSNAFNFGSFFSSKKRTEPGRIISKTEDHLVQSEAPYKHDKRQPSWTQDDGKRSNQHQPSRADQPDSPPASGSTEEAMGDQDFLILDSLEVQDDKASKEEFAHRPQIVEAIPIKRGGSQGKGIFSFSKKQKSVPSAESVSSPLVDEAPGPADVPKAKRSSFRQSFTRTFSLTRDKPRDKDRRDSLTGEKNRKYIDNNEAIGVKDAPRTKSKSTSALVDIRSWDERRGRKPDIYGSYDSSGEENRSPPSPNAKQIPALLPKQPQPEIPEHRKFTTPVGLFGLGQRKGSADQPKAKRSSFKGLKFQKSSTSSTPIPSKHDKAPKVPASPLKAKPPTSPPPPIPDDDAPIASPRTLKSAIKQRKEIDSIPKGVKVGDRVVWYNGRIPNHGTVMKLYKDGTDKYTAVVKFDRDVEGEPLSLAREGDDYIVTVEELLTPEQLGIPVSSPTSPPPKTEETMSRSSVGEEDPKSPTVRFVPSPSPEITVEPSTPISPVQHPGSDGVPPPFQEEETHIACGVRRGVPARDVSCCLETLLFSMFYTTNAFDTSLLYESGFEQDAVTRDIRNILRDQVICPLRQTGYCDWIAIKRLKDLIKTTSQDFPSLSKDADTTMSVFFSRALKLGKFISYSNDVTDYLHQLELDPKDLSKSETIQQLFEASLKQMGELKLKTIPSPALIIEIPRADDKFVRYDAIVPNLSINVSHLLENGPRLCICGAVANYECLKCTEKSKGKALVYCDNCKPMADQVHFQLHHSAELAPLPQSTYYMDLVAVMCVKEGRYSAFVKAGGQRSSPWYYYDPSEVGNPKVSLEQHLHMWIDRFERAPGKYHEALVHPLLTHFLTDSHICIYKPREKSSLV